MERKQHPYHCAMKVFFYGCCLLSILLSSCGQKNSNYHKLILAEWKFAHLEKKSTSKDSLSLVLNKFPPPLYGYNFFTADSCEEKKGFFNQDRTYLGKKTTYKIDGDSLKIFDIVKRKWIAREIVGITNDTLTLSIENGMLAKYAKFKYQLNKETLFDQVIISASGCYGNCPRDVISIKRDGEVVYNGEMYTKKIGNYQSKISKSDFNAIETDFKKANVLNLKNEYVAGQTDDEEITVTFVKNNRIIKTISDYGKAGSDRTLLGLSAFKIFVSEITIEKNSSPISNK